MVEGLIGILGIVFGTILGFILSEISTSKKERKAERKRAENEKSQANHIRTMLSLEIEYNIARLREFYDNVVKINPSGLNGDKATFLAKRVVELPFPILSRNIWDSHIREVPTVLTSHEMIEVSAIHNHFDHITDVRSELIDLYDQQRRVAADLQVRRGGHLRGGELAGYMSTKVFDRIAPELWTLWETEVLREVFDKGNPIEK